MCGYLGGYAKRGKKLLVVQSPLYREGGMGPVRYDAARASVWMLVNTRCKGEVTTNSASVGAQALGWMVQVVAPAPLCFE